MPSPTTVAKAAEKTRVFTAILDATRAIQFKSHTARAFLPVDTVVSDLHRTLRSVLPGVDAVLFEKLVQSLRATFQPARADCDTLPEFFSSNDTR